MQTVPALHEIGLLAAIDPDATAASTVTTSWVSAAEFVDFFAAIMVGTLGASATIDAKLEQATDAAGAGAKDIAGKAITQLSQAGGDADKQALIALNPSEMDAANNFTHFRLSITVAEATSDIGGAIFGVGPRIGKAEESDAATVAELVL